jgi:dipeptidyl aminopeptidase/acylaminoacyl peptidase
MSNPTSLPCGTWPSPLTPEAIATGAVAIGHVGAACGTLYWVEDRPTEKGRSVMMARRPDGVIEELLDSASSTRSRVHEYGGRPWTVVGDRLVVSRFGDQHLLLRAADGGLTDLSPDGCRYADGDAWVDPGQTGAAAARLVCVREDHREGQHSSGEPANAVVVLDLDRPGEAGRVLYGGSDFVAWPRVSADGRYLALVAWDHPAMPWDDTRLLVGRLDDGQLVDLQVVAGGPGEAVAEPQWDADGTLYFLSDRSGWANLYRWSGAASGGPRDSAAPAVAAAEPVTALDAELGGPLWSLGLKTYALTGDGRALLRIGRGAVDSLCLLDLHSQVLTPLDLPFVGFSSVGLLDADTAYAVAASRDDLPALVTIALRSGAHQVLRRSGLSPLPAEAVSRAEAIAFATTPGADGQPRQAHAWYYPPGLPGVQALAAERPPLLVVLHGGPTSCAGASFKLSVQFWTTRGFAVVDVNYGGSSGFGRAYRERLRGQWGVVDLQDAVAAVDHLVAAGRVDGARVAIRGGSAGGFTVLSALAFTQRFAAGINYYGVADLETLATDTHKFESRYLDSLVAPLPAGRAIYRARSPVHHMGQCRSALITFQGSEDKAVPPQQSRAIVEAARAAGAAVAYLEFAGEGHGFRQAPNLVRAMQAELVFLGRVFGYDPPGDLPAVEIDNASALPALR